jgi:hypothetical protein
MDNQHIKDRLKQAIAEAKQPHYGYNDIELDNLWDAIAMVEALVQEMEDPDQ